MRIVRSLLVHGRPSEQADDTLGSVRPSVGRASPWTIVAPSVVQLLEDGHDLVTHLAIEIAVGCLPAGLRGLPKMAAAMATPELLLTTCERRWKWCRARQADSDPEQLAPSRDACVRESRRRGSGFRVVHQRQIAMRWNVWKSEPISVLRIPASVRSR